MSESFKRTSRRMMVLLLITALALAVISVISTDEASAATQHFKVTTTAGLNLRSSTSASSTRLATIPYNTTIRVTSYTTANGYDWGKTTYNGKTGWVAMKYVKPSARVADGVYTLSPKCATGSRLDVSNSSQANGGNVQIWSESKSSTNQMFQITYLQNGFYKITAVHSGKALDVANGSSASKANVQQYTWNGTAAQQWQLIDGGNGYFIISNRAGDKVLDVNNAASKNGTNVWVYNRNDSNAQLWKLNSVSSSNKSTEYWAMPMKNAYATWGSNWSWLSNCNNYGRDNGDGRNYHVGVDLMSKSDTSVYSIGGGTVAEAGYSSVNGNYVTVKQSLEEKTIYAFYAHLKSVSVKANQKVDKGTKLGVAGHTGSAARNSITHLHLSVVDSLSKGGNYYGYVTKSGIGKNLAKYNGRTYYNPIYIIQNNSLPKS